MQPVARKWKEQGLDIVVVTTDQPSEIENFLLKNPAEVNFLFDSDGVVFSQYQVDLIPTGFLADRGGVLRYKGVGWSSGSLTEIQSEIEKVLK